MSETTRKNNFVGYEYKDITVNQEIAPLYADSYQNFGWATDNSTSSSLTKLAGGPFQVNMKFKRDRNIPNKVELTRLQRQFDALADEILNLERTKGLGASTAAYGIGIIGTAFLAGSVFAFLADLLPLSIILAVPGFLGWIIPYFIYLKIRKSKTQRVDPLIDQKYDELYLVCEKANHLLV